MKTVIGGFFKKKLLLEWNTFAPAFYHHDGWWVRCSVQVWNEVGFFLGSLWRRELNEAALSLAILNTLGGHIRNYACR